MTIGQIQGQLAMMEARLRPIAESNYAIEDPTIKQLYKDLADICDLVWDLANSIECHE